MTYCVAVKVEQGLVLVSDSRTNAGVDDVSTYSKMWAHGVPGERQFVICSAGNLATTQSVIAQVECDMSQGASTSLLTVASVTDAATYLGRLSMETQKRTGGGPVFAATFLLGGEVAGARCQVFRVYPEGNHISSSQQTPFLQIGETKYGKPILDRVIALNTDLDQSALCALLSMDATMRSNLTVGPPVEMNVYQAGSLQAGRYVQFGEESVYLRGLRHSWNECLKSAFGQLPPIEWDEAEADADA